MKKNDLFNMTITGITSEGVGIGRVENMVVFVPHTAVGDVLCVRILKVKKSYAYGKIEGIISPSKDRIEEDCPVYRQCGGCSFRHISYEAELKAKEQLVRDSFLKIAKMPADIFECISQPIVRADNTDFYRNKVQLPIQEENGEYKTGFFAVHTHRVVNIDNCKLQADIFDDITASLKDLFKKYKVSAYDEKSHRGLIRHIYLRSANDNKAIMLCLVINGKGLKNSKDIVKAITARYPQIKSVMLNVNTRKTNVILGEEYIQLYGDEKLRDKLLGLSFDISPNSFYQVNHAQTEKLYSIARKFASPKRTDKILDLYCGIGTIGLTMADCCDSLLGVEIVESAVKNAENNAKINNIKNARFVCTTASNIEEVINKYSFYPDIVIVDPPRKGCTQELISYLEKLNPKRIVYISCNVATLARDVELLSHCGYTCKKIAPVDMFPRTKHVETVVLLSRK